MIDNEELEKEVEDEEELGEVKPTPPEPKAKPETDDLRAIVTELASTVRAANAPKKAAEPELSAEQKAELWAVFDPEKGQKDFIRKFMRLNEDATPEQVQEAKDLFKYMHEGMMKQAIVGARNITAIELDRLRTEFKPLQDYVSKSQARELKSRFDEYAPALADTKYGKLLAAIGNTLADKEFDSEESYFKALADGAAEQIKLINPEFDLGETTKPTKSTATTSRLPRTSVGGTGGNGGGTTSGKPSKTNALAEFVEED